MARLDKLPETSIKKGLRNVIDFSSWKGIPYARKWPHTPRSHLSPATLAMNAPFGWISHAAKLISPELQTAYLQMSNTSQQVWRDEMIALYFGHGLVFEDPLP